MKKFFKRLFIFSIAGLAILTVLLSTYIHYDPFRVIRKYRDYSYPFVITNRDYISMEMFLKNYNKYHYNSFIFGSSRTMAFEPDTWRKYLPPGAIPFMFDASAESIYGIDAKLKYFNSNHIRFKNALLVFDRDVTFKTTENSSEHLYINHPLLTGQSKLAYQATFFKAYLSMKFLTRFFDYTLTGKYKPDMKGFLENRKIKYDTITNQQKILDQEDEITKDPESYYKRRKDLFYFRAGERTDSVRRIQQAHLKLLQEIKEMLEKNHINYKIVLSPLYEQVKFNQHDLEMLYKLFPGHVYDFSGKNGFTDKITNYYETAHFRPVVGDSILKIIYSRPVIPGSRK